MKIRENGKKVTIEISVKQAFKLADELNDENDDVEYTDESAPTLFRLHEVLEDYVNDYDEDDEDYDD